jgi:ketosteroid isomerase-like protein
VRGATVLRLENGRISRNSDYWDMATLLGQLGLMPSPSQEGT